MDNNGTVEQLAAATQWRPDDYYREKFTRCCRNFGNRRFDPIE